MDLPSVTYRDEPLGVFALWHDLAVRASASPKVWMDAYLAAFAVCAELAVITAELAVITIDKGFKQYKGVDLRLL